MAAPQWTGFLTLVSAGRAGKGALGFLNPIIYPLASQSQTTYFNDIVSGSNGEFSAAVGYDAVTGWGSPKALPLYNYLIAH